MQNFTPNEFEPRKSTILFIKQFARMYHDVKTADANPSATCFN
jgi:hypothetical protein